MKLLALIAAIAMVGCGSLKEPKYAKLDPIYPLPTMSLHEKAEVLEQRILDDHLNEQGYLLYSVTLPLEENYAAAHASADLPSWHGHWLLALAFKQAVEPSDETLNLIRRGIEGLRANFDATGKRGLLARAYLKYDGDEPLDWMRRYNKEDYPTKYWRKGENGYWFRTGIAKGHYESAMLGLAALVSLDKSRDIILPDETREMLHITVEDIVLHLMNGNYNIIGADGERTDFGKLSDWKYNGQSAVQVTGMLRVCMAVGNMMCTEEYNRIVNHWLMPTGMSWYGNGFRNIFGKLLGPFVSFYKPNDTIHSTSAAFMHYLATDRMEDKIQLQRNRKLLVRLGALAGRDRNPFFNYILEMLNGPDAQKRADALYTMRMFPDSKLRLSNLEKEDTKEIQPIGNLRINSQYWKTRWNKRYTKTPTSARTNVEHSAQDYLGMYWMARHYGIISEEEASKAVSW